jgi:hypothetical protein
MIYHYRGSFESPRSQALARKPICDLSFRPEVMALNKSAEGGKPIWRNCARYSLADHLRFGGAFGILPLTHLPPKFSQLPKVVFRNTLIALRFYDFDINEISTPLLKWRERATPVIGRTSLYRPIYPIPTSHHVTHVTPGIGGKGWKPGRLTSWHRS